MKKFNAKETAAKILTNVAEVNAGRISWEEFGKRNEAAWNEAHRGELCIIGSACSRRVDAVHKVLNAA